MIWISVKLYLIKEESAMKNQLKKIIHCVLITLILQSQVLSVQAAQVKFDGNKKFSAAWRNNVYTVAYDPNGGSGSMSSQQFKYDNDAVLAQNGYSRSGYEFLGWSTDPGAAVPEYRDCQNVKNITAEDNKVITLYAVWRDNVAPTVSKSFTTAGTSMGVIGDFNPATGRFDEYWQTCDVVVNFSAEDNVGITGYYLGKTNPLVSQVAWTDMVSSKNLTTQKRIGLNGENPLYASDPSGTYYFAVRDAAGNIGVSTVEAQFTWVRGDANYSTNWKSIPNTNGYTHFAISYNHTSNCMYANYGGTTVSAPNAGVCDLVVNGGSANVKWDSIPDVQTSYYYIYYK